MAGNRSPIRFAGTGVAVLVLATAGLGLTYNTSASLPPGIYRIRPLAAAEPARGQIVGFCLAGETGRLAMARRYVHPEGLEPLIYGTRCPSGAAVVGKPVAGLPGDTIEFTGQGVLVNGRLLRRSQVQRTDRSGRILPATSHAKRILRPGEFWLQSEFAQNSFDSRIVGPVPKDSILDRRVFVIGFAPLFYVTGILVAAAAGLARRPSVGGGRP